ncbi:MAG: Esterase/lipase/thioesterase [Stictis urceolatum]|nr:Esterase/lipase/thioesterase [Stictis urceolata]
MKANQLVLLLNVLSPLAVAHGYVSSALIGGTNYTLYNPNVDPYSSPVPQRINRKIPGNGPITDVSLIDIQCNGYTDGGFTTAPAPLSAPVAAGSQVSLVWTQWPDSHKGPLVTYMASCGSADCSKFTPGSSAVWFKIHEAGKDSSGTWATEPLETNPATPFKFTIPATLKPGNYLIRHEIIALHSAYTYPGAQFYPSTYNSCKPSV